MSVAGHPFLQQGKGALGTAERQQDERAGKQGLWKHSPW